MQQHAGSSISAVAEEAPIGLTLTEWQTIRGLVPGYSPAQLRADLAKLSQRPGVRNAVGVLIAAYRRGEPIWGRDDLQVHNAAVTAQHIPPAADPPAPRYSRPGRQSPTAPPPLADHALLAPHGALWDHLLLLMPDAELVDWLCSGFELEVRDDTTVLHCRQCDHAVVARELRGLLIDALRDLGLTDTLVIRAPQEAERLDSVAAHAPTPAAVLVEQPSGAVAHPTTATSADQEPTAPPLADRPAALEGRTATAPPPAGQELPSMPLAPPASSSPTARAVPPGVPDRLRRPHRSPSRAS